MTSLDNIRAVLSLYAGHGWTLRRVLLSDTGPASQLRSELDLPADVELVSSDIDAAFFSRPRKDGSVTWELRRLTDPPYALVVVLEQEASDEEVLTLLTVLEKRMRVESSRSSTSANGH